MIKAVIFDLDGTLMDTLLDIRTALNEALRTRGFNKAYDYLEVRSFIGRGTDHLLRKALEGLTAEYDFPTVKKTYMENYERCQLLHPTVYPGISETLGKLGEKGLTIHVCSNKPDPLCKKIIEVGFGMETFESVDGQKEGFPPKPDPHIVNEIMARLSLKPEEVLFVGDSLPDLETARNANVRCCLVQWGYGDYDDERLEGADFRIKEPAALLGII